MIPRDRATGGARCRGRGHQREGPRERRSGARRSTRSGAALTGADIYGGGQLLAARSTAVPADVRREREPGRGGIP